MNQSPSPDPRTPRAEPESFRARALSASLTVNDIAKSLAFYHDVLGFTVDRRHEREGTLFSVSLKAGDVRVLLNQDDGKKGLNRVKGVGFSLQFTTEQDIDTLAATIRERGGRFETEPMDTRFGTRIFRVADPDGFKLTISSPRKG